MNKVLTITLKTVDQATAPVRALVSTISGMTSKIFGALTSMRTLAVGFAANLAGGAVLNAIRSTIDRLDELAERSRAIGLTAEQLQVYEFAAKQANVASEELFAVLRKGTENMAEFAATGGGPAAKMLRELGIEANDAAGNLRPIGALIEDLRKKTEGLGAGARQRAFGDIFGKGGGLVERLTAGQGFASARSELDRLGGLVSEADVTRAAKVSDAMDRVAISWRGVKDTLVLLLAGPLESLLNRVAEMTGRFRATIAAIADLLPKFLSGDKGVADFGQRLMTALQDAWDLVKTLIVEGGDLIRVAIVNAIAGAVALAWPAVEDKLGTSLYAITGGLLGRVATDLEKDLDEAERRLKNLRDKGYTDYVYRPGSSQASSFQLGLNSLPSAMVPVSAQIASQEQVLGNLRAAYSRDVRARAQQTLDVMKPLYGEVVTRSQQAGAAIAAALEKSRASMASIVQLQRGPASALVNLNSGVDPLDEAGAADGTKARIADGWRKVFAVAQQAGSRFTDWVRGTALPQVRSYVLLLTKLMTDQAVGAVQSDAQMRLLEATGRGDEAARIRLVNEQIERRNGLMAQMGGLYARVREQVEAADAAEIAKLTTEQVSRTTLDALTRAEASYATAVQVRAAEQQAGTISTRAADLANKEGLRSLLERTGATREAVANLVGQSPALREQLLGTLTELDGKIADIKLKLSGEGVTTNFFDGMSRGWKQLTAQARDYAKVAEDLVVNGVTAVASGLSNAFVDAISGVKSFGQAVKEMAASVLKMVAQMILQFLILRAITGIFGAAAGGVDSAGLQGGLISTGGFNKGGRIPGYALGGLAGLALVAGPNVNADRVPAYLTAGEMVLNRSATRANMGALIHANNGGKLVPVGGGAGGDGGGVGSITINQTINVTGGSGGAQAAGRAAREGVLAALDDAGVVEKMKRKVGV